MTYEFTGFFARPNVPWPANLPQGTVWREISTPFIGVGVRLPGSEDRHPTPAETDMLIRQLGLEAADCWIYLIYVCWGGGIDFVYGFGSRDGVLFGAVKEFARDAEKVYTDLMEQFGVPAEVALQFEPFRRGYWCER
jgi:hypothetical protein